MKLVFMGTPSFSIPTLDVLRDKHDVLVVVTKPDMPKGRHLKMTESEVKKYANSLSLPILQPEILNNNDDFINQIKALSPDAVVVVAYGKIIPKWLLELPPYGCVNLHASLLPEYRGAAPIQRAILDGKKITGITTMLLDEGMDTGDILLSEEVDIGDDDDAGTLNQKLSVAGAELMIKTLDGLVSGEIKPSPQDNSAATTADKIGKDETKIIWEKPAEAIMRQIKAMSPSPGAYTTISGNRIKIYKATVEDERSPAGTIISDGKHLIIAAVDKGLNIEILQPEGKRVMSAVEFLAGHRLKAGEGAGN